MNKKKSSFTACIAPTSVYNWSNGFATIEDYCTVQPNDYDAPNISKRMYIEFDMPCISKQKSVKSAVLQLGQTDGCSTRIGVYRALRAPREGQYIPFSIQYPFDYSDANFAQVPTLHSFDITSAFHSEKPSGKLYLEVRATDETEANSGYARFASKGHTKYYPRIVIKTEKKKQDTLQTQSVPYHAINFLSGHGFDSFLDLSKWHEEFDSDDFEIAPKRDGALFGNAAALFRSYNDTAQENGISQTVRLYTAGTYIFSAYLRILEDVVQSAVNDTAPGMYLRICANGRILAQSQPIAKTGSYVRICLPFTARTCETVEAEIKMNGKGCALVDGAQLEYKAAHPYNLLKNAAFTEGLAEWKYSPFTVRPGMTEIPSESFGRCVTLLSDPDHKTYICQSIPPGASGNEKKRYTFSAIANVNGGVPNTFHQDKQSSFRIGAKIVYTDNFCEDHYAEFSPHGEAFTYAEVVFSPSKNHIAKRIDVFCEYIGNFGYANFANLCLTTQD